MNNPLVIQGGMGIGVSGWRLAKAVSQAGQLGVISGTGLDRLLTRTLQNGDQDGNVRRALAAFPCSETAKRIIDEYFVRGGISSRSPFKRVPFFTIKNNDRLNALNVAANFVETWLAKEGHPGKVGINYLAKLQLPTLSSIYGALLAGVDYIIMGAGIPIEIPGVIRDLSRHEETSMRLDVEDAGKEESFFSRFNPKHLFTIQMPEIKIPKFLPIVSSNFLASVMVSKANGPVDGIIVEGPSAGGHNAPPRGRMLLDDEGEPIYGKRDIVDMDKLQSLGIPFWLAGSYGSPEGLQQALDSGAAGIQAGTPFALCRESGFFPEIKERIISIVGKGKERISTDTKASPTGFPFKLMEIDNGPEPGLHRERACNLGYLRTLYKREDGSIGYRCPAEPAEAFSSKGGLTAEAIKGKKCLCNSLFAAIGLPTVYEDGTVEKALITIGSKLDSVRNLISRSGEYSARQVIDYILGNTGSSEA